MTISTDILRKYIGTNMVPVVDWTTADLVKVNEAIEAEMEHRANLLREDKDATPTPQ